MESCANFKPKSIRADSKLKNPKSTPIDFGVESSMKYSKLELFLVDSKLELLLNKISNNFIEKMFSNGIPTFKLVSTKIN